MKNNKLRILLSGLIAENPVFVLILGTCPTLAQTGSVVSALGMGLAATAVLVLSNLVISLLRKIIPESVRIPCYIVVIAGFVSVVQMVMHAYLPDMYDMMGVYLALIVVNCIILGRAEMFARKNGPIDSALDGLGMGLGFLIALVAMATVREVFGAASFAGFEIPFLVPYKIPILVQSPGGFMVFGFLVALTSVFKKGDKKQPREFSCASCPSAQICKRGACAEGERPETAGEEACE